MSMHDCNIFMPSDFSNVEPVIDLFVDDCVEMGDGSDASDINTKIAVDTITHSEVNLIHDMALMLQ